MDAGSDAPNTDSETNSVVSGKFRVFLHGKHPFCVEKRNREFGGI